MLSITSSNPYNYFAEKKKKKTMVNEALLMRTVRYQQANDHSGHSRAASPTIRSAVMYTQKGTLVIIKPDPLVQLLIRKENKTKHRPHN